MDYFEYVSDYRFATYVYEDDNVNLKINLSTRETPFLSDGIKGKCSNVLEVFYYCDSGQDEVYFSGCGIEGEMSYMSVKKCYYLCSSDYTLEENSTKVTIKIGQLNGEYTLTNIVYDNVISGRQALEYVVEQRQDLFDEMTKNRAFMGEIYVRILEDDKCYYYVGVCDENKKITAFLVDGEDGKIIATRELEG